MRANLNPIRGFLALLGVVFLSSNLCAQSNAWLRLTYSLRPATVKVDSFSFLPGRPDTLLELKTGNHTIQALAPERGLWNVRDFQKNIWANAGDTLCVRVEFSRYVLLVSSPAGAEIEQKGRNLGKTPLLLSLQAIQKGPLTFRKLGYLVQTIQPQEITSGRIWIKLTPRPDYWQEQKHEQQQRLAHRRKFYHIATGLALAAAGCGTSSLLFKRKANRLYDHYLHTPFPEDIRNSYNAAHKYDTIAGTSYIFFELNLIGSTYFILKALSIP